jgi:DNA polymerase-1
MGMKKALILDANALLHRAWHALPPMTTPTGVVVNAVYGFASVLIKILQSEHPDVLAVCWDTPEPTFRHEAFKAYKAQREEQPDAFYNQIPLAQKVVEVLGGTNAELPGFEADDLLGTLATRLEKSGHEVLILTGDKDAFQLVSPAISVMSFKKGVSETVLYTPKTLVEITGLKPEQIVDYKVMRGDPSDNVPGIRGIGEKTATELLQKYDDLKGIFIAAHDPKSKLADGVRSKLIGGEALAKELEPIMKIVTDAPLKVAEKDLIRRPVNQQEVLDLFSEFGFKSLVSRIISQPPTDKSQVTSHKSNKDVKTRTKGGIRVLEAKDLNKFVESAKKDEKVYVYLPETTQGSLFDDLPVLVLGTDEAVLSVTKNQLTANKKLIANVLADETIIKSGHGLKLVWHWANREAMELNGIGFDMEIAAYLLAAGERGHDLNTVSAMYLHKVPQANNPAEMIGTLIKLEDALAEELKSRNLTNIMEKIEMPLLPVLAKMEKLGIKIDRTYLKDLSKELQKEKKILDDKMQAIAGEPFNPLSPKQLSKVLFETLKISTKGIKHGKTGISTASAELDKMRGLHPIIELIEQYRELSKLLSTYIDALPLLADKDDRVHTTFNQAVTATGRLSSSDPNLQNIPIRTELGRKVRGAFVASKGMVLLSCDYSQIELRIAAALSKDVKMLEAFEKGQDIHTATAASIWDLDPKKITKEQRRVAKAINFGLIFGQGPQGLARSADISYEEARDFIDRYFAAFSGMREWMEYSKAIAAKRGFVETLFGRRRPLPEINSPLAQVRAQAERMAINMPVQGTEADLIKMAMIKIDQVLPSAFPNVRMLLQVHDELVFELPKDQVKKVAPVVVDIMQNIEKIGCPIVVDTKVGEDWGEME